MIGLPNHYPPSMLSESHPLIRRILRFLALPYCYFVYVNWEVCPRSRTQVIKDLLFIFFKLKYFPDNYSLCRLWEKPRNEWAEYYGSIYDPLQRAKLRRKVLPMRYRVVYDDKHLCHQLCIANNIPVPEFHGIVDRDNFHHIASALLVAEPQRALIVKPFTGRGGQGICLIYVRDDRKWVRTSNRIVALEEFKLPTRSVIQTFIQQHEALQRFSGSVNTVRVATLLSRDGEVLVLGALVRFGVGGAFVDNTSQGGVKVGVDPADGRLMRVGCDKQNRQYEKHPTSGISFGGFQIPHWNQVVQLAERVQLAVPYNLLIGQDIAVGTNGPFVIELNAEYDNVGLEQACGPILANKEVLKAFNEYDLLINKYQKSLIRGS